ncbi:MAG: tRNA 5-methoxyuridine(34)/uridine 5-oxyacetic acid(34) synthase CmoB [Candidatus Margulisiibacteriota bacterium]|nr:tRNA 5-methoxyuridine(34)/uridine 5-oxyacetic acid(34) synthase CmoB [Candidatus Margulisiibacteriota bacterium]
MNEDVKEQLILDFENNNKKVCRSLPIDDRVNHSVLKFKLDSIKDLLYNPNTHKFFSSIQQLPFMDSTVDLNQSTNCISIDLEESDELRDALKQLIPWRKGPFALGNILIDAEWQSNLKWDRFSSYYNVLENARILDIGCGNGYYMFRMLEHEPRMVLGIDPSQLTYMQFRAIQHYAKCDKLNYLPLGWADLDIFNQLFDVVFCMGIMYHHRSPVDLLKIIRSVARPSVKLFFDTLIIPGDEDLVLFPKDRYAKMPNVYFLPTESALKNMLNRAGFKKIDVMSINKTTSNEQRVTDWTFNKSLADFLDPNDPSKTVEGYPAPLRIALVASTQ